MSRLLVLVALLCLATPAAAQTRLVIVSGLGGQPQYTRQFSELSVALAEAATRRAGLPDSSVTWLGEGTNPAKWFRGPSTRANIEATLRALAGRPGNDAVVVVLIGHGSGEGAATRISLPGPDLAASDFARLLGAFGSRRVAFVNLSSGSGDMLGVLAAPNRVVLTATKSAFERNETQFGRFFVDAFARDGADTDKDGRVSLFEAFTYAEAEVKRFYETEGRLATEHPQIAHADDLARRFFLTPGPSERIAGDPRLGALYAKRDSLEEQVRTLRGRKDAMAAATYERELEALLVSLAETTAEIRKAEGGQSR